MIVVLKMGQLRFSPYFSIDMELCALSLEDYLYRTSESINAAVGLPQLEKLSSFSRAICILGIMTEIASGVTFIHSYAEVHRDLKPSNGNITF